MRFVDRTKFPAPNTLNSVSDTEFERVRSGKDARGKIYAADDVRQILQAMYLGKCAFCEVKLGDHREYEHFHPWKGNEPEHRAYRWENINVTCKPCNDRKRATRYKCKRDCLVYTVLMDPSLPLDSNKPYPFKFLDQSSKSGVEIVADYAESIEAINTAAFLSDSMCIISRQRRFESLLQALMATTVYRHIEHWRRIAALRKIQIPDNDSSRLEYMEMLQEASNIYNTYLAPWAEFSTAISQRALSAANIQLSSDDFEFMDSAWQNIRSSNATP